MVSTHCHLPQKAAYGRARASSYCIYSFFNVARYAIPVARNALPVAHYAICVSHEDGNLYLGGTIFHTNIIILIVSRNIKSSIVQHCLTLIRKWFETRNNMPGLKKIIWAIIGVLRWTVVDVWHFNNLCRSQLLSQVMVLVYLLLILTLKMAST